MNKVSRRVVVAIDASCDFPRTFDEAAEMAERIGAELEGIFIEDANLLNLARLPCASEVGIVTGSARGLNAETVGRTLKGFADRARLAMARAAERRKVRWTFTTACGTLLGQLLEAANPKDTVARGASPRGGWRFASRPARSVLLLHLGPCVKPEGTAVVLIDAGCASMRNLPLAIALADQSCTVRTLVVIVSDSPVAARRQRALVAEALAAEGIASEIRTTRAFDAEGLLAFLGNAECGALIMASGAPLLEPVAFAELVEKTGFPVFVIR